MADTTPRPLRHAHSSLPPSSPPPSSPLTTPPSSPLKSPSIPLTTLPPHALLLALPGLLAHPPDHPLYLPSLNASLNALRRCIFSRDLSPDVECRALTAFSEVGMQVINGDFARSGDHPWADGVEDEVQHTIGKGLIIAQKHPVLRAYWHRLSMLQAELAHRQNNPKFSRRLLQRLLASLTPSDPPHFAYSVHLASITHLLSPPPSLTTGTASSSMFLSSSAAPSSEPSSSSLSAYPKTFSPSAQNIHAALIVVDTLHSLSISRSHPRITLLAELIRLRILAGSDNWAQAGHSLTDCESTLEMKFERPAQPVRGKPPAVLPQHRLFEDAFDAAAAIHVLLLGVVYWTHKGVAAEASARLAHLHALMDSKALNKFPDGIVQIELPGSHPLYMNTTHPRILFLLTYLVSTTSRRDGIGRNPKRKVFASEGLRIWDQEAKIAFQLSLWADASSVRNLERKAAMIKADLFCELIAVSIMRSEFDAAEQNLNQLISHVQTYEMFDDYAARITLHHAHLAHARGRIDRARDCYRVAAHVSSDTSFVHVSARAGEVACMIGARASRRTPDTNAMDVESISSPGRGLSNDEREEVCEVAEMCREMGGALEAIGDLLEASASSEIIKSKSHLKSALDRASNAQDNHLRAIILALVSSYYFHTAEDQAEQMLKTCRQLATGLGGAAAPAGSTPSDADPVGNAPLGLWVGERFVELYRRNGEDEKAALQNKLNARLERALVKLRSEPEPS